MSKSNGNGNYQTPVTGKKPGKRFRWAKTLLIVVAVLVAAGFASWEMAASSTKTLILRMADFALHGKNENYNVVGDVGGVPFAIPRTVARWVEYDDEPLYRQQRKALPDERTRTTHDKLASFGFTAHFPDMELETADVRKREREREREHGKETMFDTTWIDIGVKSHSHYLGGFLGLERQVRAISGKLAFRDPSYGYQKQPELIYGLVAYYPVRQTISARGELAWESVEESSFYYHVDENGRVDAHIKCSFVKYASSPCEQSFFISSGIDAIVDIHYRHGLLPHWQEIQNSFRDTLLGFVVDEAKPSVTQYIWGQTRFKIATYEF